MSFEFIKAEGGKFLLLGSWTISNYGELKKELQSLSLDKSTSVSGESLRALDSTGASLLLRFFGANVNFVGISPAQQKLLTLVGERLCSKELSTKSKPDGPLIRIGKAVSMFFHNIKELLSFIGQFLSQSTKLRFKEFAVQLERGLVDAIGIVALVSLLIGVVVAYLFAIQLEKYGGNIFIVDSVSVAMCRELAPVVAAIIVAGRSGSAFTAQIGAMKLNEEVDAMKTLGLSVMQVLVLPRVLALMLAMPLLTFIGDFISVMGGVVVAEIRLGVSSASFAERLSQVPLMNHAAFGLSKAPVFALFIATIGCRMGLKVEDTARSVGENTTSTVVQSIVAVIILNALFAVTAAELGI